MSGKPQSLTGSLTMIKLRANMEVVKKVIVEQDLDFLLVITGRERIGKSSLALHIAEQVDPDFTIDQVVFDTQSLYEQVYSLKPGSVVVIDEGATAFFSRDAMSTDVKDGIKLLTVMGERNLFVIINVPSFFILDKYIREHRVSSLIRVVARGRFKFFSRRRLKAAFFNPKAKKFSWGDPSFKDSFPKYTGKFWEPYTKKKREYLAARKSNRLEDNGKDKWIKLSEAAKLTLLPVQTLRNWCKNGRVKAMKNAAGNFFVAEESVEELELKEPLQATRVTGGEK